MKKLKIIITAICIFALVGAVFFERIEINKRNEEINLMRIVAVERNAKVLQNGAINVRETTGRAFELYKKMNESISDKNRYNTGLENMENAYSAMKRTETDLEEEIRILFPYGFDEDSEYEKNLKTYISRSKEYSNLAQRQYEIIKGFFTGTYDYDYTADTWEQLRSEMGELEISKFRNAHEIIERHFAK